MAESGWDNRTFRLGAALLARLPTAEWYVAAVAKEHTWLPRLAPHLPLPIPAPVALGSPGARWPGCSPDSGDEVHVSGLDLARNPAQVHLDARAYGFAVDGRTVGLLIGAVGGTAFMVLNALRLTTSDDRREWHLSHPARRVVCLSRRSSGGAHRVGHPSFTP